MTGTDKEEEPVNLYDDAHLGGAVEEEQGRRWLEEQEVTADAFAALVKGWLDRCTVTDDELAKAFDISRPACARWRAGGCRPHPLMRKHIRVFFAKKLAEERDA